MGNSLPDLVTRGSGTDRERRTLPNVRRARVAVHAAFFLNGFLLASWVVNLPVVETRTQVSHSTLGSLLLLLGLGSFISMQVGGWAVDRVGSRRVTIVGVALLGAASVLPGLVSSALGLAVVIALLGIGNGALDVAMNAHAVVVERRYARPLMSSFHAFFSIGGAVGAALGAVGHACGAPLLALLVTAAAVGLAVGSATLPHLLKDTAVGDPSPGGAYPSPRPASTYSRRHVLTLAVLAFLLMLAEGVAADWSALQAREHVNASSAAAPLAYAAFAVSMTGGRLVADRFADSFGSRSVVRFGAVAATLGLVGVATAPNLLLTLLGWLVFGFGLSGAVPQVFSAAGRLSVTSGGVLMSRVVGAGYVGLLAGPAAVGWIAGGTSLSGAFLLPAVLCLVAAACAGVLSKDHPRA